MERFTNRGSSTLDGGIDASQTTLDVVDASTFPSDGDFRILIDSEIMLVTGVAAETFTVVRGQEGTSGAAHSNAADVFHVLTAGALETQFEDDLILRDVVASRPAAGTPGRLYLPTDGCFIYRDTGNAWKAYGPIFNLTPPEAADFGTWVNQGAATATDNKGALYLAAPAVADEQIRAIVKSAPATPYTITAAFIINLVAHGLQPCAGLCIRNSSSGDIGIAGGFYDFSVDAITGVSFFSYTSPTAARANGFSIPGNVSHAAWHTLLWVRYEDDGTDRTVSFSYDGINYFEFITQDRTTNFTADQVGIAINVDGAGTPAPGGVTCVHWDES